MLKQIQIKGFRSCHEVVLRDLGAITAFVGQNGSGKTNLLRAIRHFADLATAQDILPVLLTLEPISFLAEIELNSRCYRYAISLRTHRTNGTLRERQPLSMHEKLTLVDGDEPSQVLFERQESDLQLGGQLKKPDRNGTRVYLGSTISALAAISTLAVVQRQLVSLLDPVYTFLRHVVYYPLDESNEIRGDDAEVIISHREFELWKAETNQHARTRDSVQLRLLSLFLEKKDLFETLLSWLDARWLRLFSNIHVEVIEPVSASPQRDVSSGVERYYRLYFEPETLLGGGKQPRHFGELSLGTRRILRILTSLLVDDSSVMLLEHPEEGLHPGLLYKLLGILKGNSDQTQVLLSSHSPTVLNSLEPEALRLVTIANEATTVRSLTGREIKHADAFIKEEGSLADFVETLGE